MSVAAKLSYILGKYHREITFATKVSNLAVEFVKTPGWASASQIAFGTLEAYAEVGAVSVHQILGTQDWATCVAGRLDKLAFNALHACPRYDIRVSDQHYSLTMVTLGDFQVAVSRCSDGEITLYAKYPERTAVQADIARRVRKHYPRASIVNVDGGRYGETVYSMANEEVLAYHTPMTMAFGARIRKYNDKGVSRSIMLHGPPGTGKTTFAQSTLEYLGYRSLRFRIGMISSFSLTDLRAMLDLFQPDAVLVDDFDRLKDETSSLEMLEVLNRRTKVLLATVNTLGKFSGALRRPQRFDETVEIKTLDPEVVRGILRDSLNVYFDRVCAWPISYIIEFAKRVNVEGHADAEKWIIELEERCAEEGKPPATPGAPKTPETKPG
jgi:ATPase family protein associated with various cellular activities (AAA)